MNRAQIQKKEVSKITKIFNPAKFENYDDAMDQLEFLARDSSMPEAMKILFNRNFYGFVTLTAQQFKVDFDVFKDTAKGIAKLIALTPDEKDSINLVGDDDKYSLKLLDEGGKYKSTFNEESGKCRFPSHWFSLYHVVMANNL